MAYPGRPKYSLVRGSDSDKDEEAPFLSSNLPPSPKLAQISLFLQAGTFVIMTIILAILLFTSSLKPSPPTDIIPSGISRLNPSPGTRLQPCGQDAATAKANGCIFDLTTISWLPLRCYDASLASEFLSVASEPFFYDKAGTQPIPGYSTLSETEGVVYTTRRYLVYHCAYAWRFIHRALERGAVLESGLTGYEHTERCSEYLLNRTIPLEEVGTGLMIEFPDC